MANENKVKTVYPENNPLPPEETACNESTGTLSNNNSSEEKVIRQNNLKKLGLLFIVSLTALLATLCIILFISTLPSGAYVQYAGSYAFSHAEHEGEQISPDNIEETFSLRLSNNGWAHFYFADKVHYGRWKINDEKLIFRIGNHTLSADAENDILRLNNIMGRGIDLILLRV